MDLKQTKAIFVDIDNTISTGHYVDDVNTEDILALQKLQQKDIYVILSTGRSEKDALEIREKIKINQFGDFTIVSNGSKIFGKDQEVIYENCLSSELFSNLLEFCKKNKYIIKISNIDTLYSDSKIALNFISKIYKRYTWKKYDEINESILINDNLLKLGLFFFSKKDALIALKELKQNFSETEIVLTGSGYYIEITNKEVSKASAAEVVAKKLGFGLENAIAFGDSLNDLSIFSIVGYKVSVENAMEELKQISDHVTLDVKKSGVSVFINDFLLKE